jgi:hypothetical protein
LLAEGDAIEPAEDIDPAVTRIIHGGREIPASRHRSAIADPGVAGHVVDLDDVKDNENVVSAEYINAVRIRVVNRRGIHVGGRNARQRSPCVINRIILVKGVEYATVRVKAAHRIGQGAVTAYRHRLGDKRIIGDNVPWAQTAWTALAISQPSAGVDRVSLRQREWNHAHSEQ